MEQTNRETEPRNQANGFFAQPRCFLSRDREYLIIALPGNMMVRKHVNYFKQVLGVPFEPKKQREVEEDRVV